MPPLVADTTIYNVQPPPIVLVPKIQRYNYYIHTVGGELVHYGSVMLHINSHTSILLCPETYLGQGSMPPLEDGNWYNKSKQWATSLLFSRFPTNGNITTNVGVLLLSIGKATYKRQ